MIAAIHLFISNEAMKNEVHYCASFQFIDHCK